MTTKTVNTSAASYLTAAEFLKRADLRTVGDLCSDTGTRITAAALLTNDNLTAALLDASGILEQAMLRGQLYQPVDLAALTGAGQAALFRLLTRLTTCLLFERRPDLELKQPWLWEAVEEQLQKLREGERIFSFLETQAAGILNDVTETATDVQARDGITYQMKRYFGRRGNRNDPTHQ